MRKVTRDASRAFINGTPFKCGNTQVRVSDGYIGLLLHGKVIAAREQGRPLGETVLSLRGWNTPTTRERLNGLLEHLGYPHLAFVQRNFCAFIQNWDGTKVAVNIYSDNTVRSLVDDLLAVKGGR